MIGETLGLTRELMFLDSHRKRCERLCGLPRALINQGVPRVRTCSLIAPRGEVLHDVARHPCEHQTKDYQKPESGQEYDGYSSDRGFVRLVAGSNWGILHISILTGVRPRSI